jgi:site-specific DNA recombinase
MVACYTRVSTTEQANEGYSLEEQSDRLQKYCSAMGWNVFKIYVDGGFSGSNTNRPALEELINDVKAHKVDKVVVWKLDRLSRSQKDTLYLIEDVFLANNCDFVSMNENFDTSTPFGKAMIGILAVFAQLEMEQIKERMQMGRDARAKKGLFNGSRVSPVGYNYVDGKLVPDELDRIQVKKIFEMYASGIGYAQIAKTLNDSGLYHHFNHEWSRKTVRYVVQSPVYIGKVALHDEWINGIHEPLISEELFEKCQYIRTHKGHVPNNSGLVSSYLGGLLVCAQCGAKYSKYAKKVKGKDGKVYEYNKYYCNSRSKRSENLIHDPNCKNKIWDMQELDDIIFSEVQKLALDPKAFEQTCQEDTKKALKEPILKQISKIESQISKLMELYSLDMIPVEELQTKINDLYQQKRKLENTLSSAEHEQGKSVTKSIAWEKVRLFNKMSAIGEFDDLKGILDLLISKIELDGENITIFWNF